MGAGSTIFSARQVLWCMVFCGFAVNYMIRINLNIAIVSMVRHRSLIVVNETINEKLQLVLDSGAENVSESSSSTQAPGPSEIYQEEDGFIWDEYQQGLILGAFFWLHWITQVPGGILARKYGTKLVFGLSNFLGCLFCFITPLSAYMNYQALIFLRVIQGIVCGFAWPSMHNMTALWIPPNERSKFVTAYLGSSVGAALTFPLCGYIISWWNWEGVFYVTGMIGTFWFICWWLLIFDSPAQHPRIGLEEKECIEKSLGESITKKPLKTPWKELLLSRPVWMNIIAQWGGIWGIFTLMTQAPTYFKQIHGWNIRMTGMLSGMPHIMRMVFAYFFSLFGDYMLRTDKMSRTNVRKMATAVCCIGQGIFMAGLAFSGNDHIAAIVFMTLATAVNGAVSTGPLASFVDLSPNYASITLGLSGMISVMPGFISPAIVGILTFENQTIEQWQKVFLLATAMLVVCGLLYLVFADSNLQSWNSPDKIVQDPEEIVPMTEKPRIVITKNSIPTSDLAYTRRQEKKANNVDIIRKNSDTSNKTDS
ncbi:sialin-like [Ctenocephalides felis]|uniref:sialin-like n=2 Tax=Ctenocephalides felis TaxID=7515 RepID=UPI000E6E4971|nr:sialin-like [Ctenocephalides felis]